jgi:type III pantothenate kinase
MNLIIDIGNTQTKVSVFDNSEISKFVRYDFLSRKELQSICAQFPNIKNAILSSVINHKKEITDFLSKRLGYENFVLLNHETALPIENLYKTKTTLGNDRIAVAVGANSIFPSENILIVDFGTAITYEIVNEKNQYLGGNISPGLETRYKALNNFTKKLPMLSKRNNFSIIGNSTESAITAGVQQGIIFEIEGYIDYLTKKFNNLKVIFTGGDTFFFDKKLKNTIFAQPNLVHIGLNRILEFNRLA